MDEILSFFGGEAVFFTALVITVLAIIAIAKTATVVPQQSAFIVESLGKYSKTLSAGFHILIPFIDKIAQKRGESLGSVIREAVRAYTARRRK